MIANDVLELWVALAPAVADHLWQSTLFAVAAGLFTLVLRKNYARARYWLWLAASLKFLVPFSLFVAIGNHVSWTRNAGETDTRLYLVINKVSEAFTPAIVPVSSGSLGATPFASLMHLLSTLVAAVWLCGSVVIITLWCVRWRKISETIREASPLREGREVKALRRMECIGGVGRRIDMISSPTTLEPGIFGIVRPVLLWPQEFSEHLEDAHLEAIVAHEVLHVLRRDNLAAAMHMMVEAVFWFHPLVWWLGSRLVDERERACDEGVLQLGSERQVYAESLLKTCEFCLGSRLICLSGVTGAELKKRIVHIMSRRGACQLDSRKKLLLGAAGLLAIAVPTLSGSLNTIMPGAEAVTKNPAIAPLLEAPSTNGDNRADRAALPVSTGQSPRIKACSKSKHAGKRISPGSRG